MYRIRLLFAFFTFLMVLVWFRLFYWQILQGSKIQVLAGSQHVGKFQVVASRGEFYSSDGFPLVLNSEIYRVVVNPFELTDNEENVSKSIAELVIKDEDLKRSRALQIIREASGATDSGLVHYTDVEKKTKIDEESSRLRNIFKQKELRWAQLYPEVTKEIKSEIEKLKIKSITLENAIGRMYPEASLSGTLSGILGYDVNGNPKGSYGLEGYYNGEISGKSGKLRQEQDAFGRALVGGDFRNISARNGSDLKLHIDRTAQYIVQKKLQEGLSKYGAKDGSVVVMDPKTGAIIAMVSLPVFDPDVRKFFPTSWYKNPIVADTYEPGSTFKTLVMAAGLDAGVINYNTICPVCSGPRKIDSFLIRTWNNKYMEKPTMLDILVNSDNTGMVYIGEKLGKEKMHEYLNNFGFGGNTGIDLEDESSLPLRDSKKLRTIDFATESFGQGIAVTPIQMV
ncbi:MAG: penicillin-binding protein 2, partial [bacterium]|nr:penicillin-binding protein 2 [bacterium]